jgi:RHS repeat-associated protein
MDDVKRIALVETLTVDNGTAANSVTQRYQLSNNIESATLELDETASIISYEEYYPYGDTSYQAGRNVAEVGLKRYRYTGKEKDEESGLYYMLARYYSGWLGRWTASDPAGLVDGPNLYMYCRGNPVGLVDQKGTETKDPAEITGYYPGAKITGPGEVTFSDVDIKGGQISGTYLPGDETDELTSKSTLEEIQAFTNRQGYKLIDIKSKDELYWYEDGDQSQYMVPKGKLVSIDFEHKDDKSMEFEAIDVPEYGSDIDDITESEYQRYADAMKNVETAAEVANVGTDATLSTVETAYNRASKDIEKKVSEMITNNNNLTADAVRNAQKSSESFSNAATKSAKFFKKAGLVLSIVTGAMDVADYALQGNYKRAALSAGLTAAGSIAAVVLIGAASLPAVFFASIGISLIIMFFDWLIGTKIIDGK